MHRFKNASKHLKTAAMLFISASIDLNKGYSLSDVSVISKTMILFLI